MAVPHVAIIIVTYNGCSDTLECLSSLRKLTYGNYTIVLVDQKSRDGTPAAVEIAFPEVHVICSETNGGFAAGNNRGIEFAFAQGAEFVFLLNNDTIVDPGMLETLVASAARDATIGIAGPLMLYYDAPETIWSAGGSVGRRGESVMLEQGRPAAQIADAGRTGALVDVEFVVGCGMLIRRSALEQVGFMDERFFLYYEEADLCARMKASGWRIVTENTAALWHKVSRSTGTDSDLTLYYMRRNVLLYVEKNAPDAFAARLRVAFDALRLEVCLLRTGRWRRAQVLLRANLDYVLRRFGRAEWITP